MHLAGAKKTWSFGLGVSTKNGGYWRYGACCVKGALLRTSYRRIVYEDQVSHRGKSCVGTIQFNVIGGHP